MLKFIPNTTLIAIFVLTIIVIGELGIAGWTILERDRAVSSLNEISARVTTLERSSNLAETAWIDPLSVAKAQLSARMDALEKALDTVPIVDEQELRDLKHTIEATKNSFLMHRDYHPLLTDYTLLLVNALYSYEAILWAEGEDKVTAVSELGFLISIVDDDQLTIIFEDVISGEVDPSRLWHRLQYLLWDSLKMGWIMDIEISRD